MLHSLLTESKYDKDETRYLVDGFSKGFDIHYCGPEVRKDGSHNIPFHVGDDNILWKKFMDEVKLGRYAGPFDKPPFENYVQSPVGLVPKRNGKVRLIFHLSYDFKDGQKSINHYTPKELCLVKYEDLDHAIENSLRLKRENPTRSIYYAKTNLTSAFRLAPLKKTCFKWLLMAVRDPRTNKKQYFVEKNLPFGHSISCSVFQRFSRALKHILEFATGSPHSVTTYLDDFLFQVPSSEKCSHLVSTFRQICEQLGVPIAEEKTVEATTRIEFLEMILDGTELVIMVPEEKRNRAVNWLLSMSKKRKSTVKELERLAGLLNFINKAVIPGRAFTRRMYAKFAKITEEKNLQGFHHLNLDKEFKADCNMWLKFLNNLASPGIARPFIDVNSPLSTVKIINFTSDASETIGFGSFFNNKHWLHGKWEPGFVKIYKPSIEFLELYAFCMGVFVWIEKLIEESKESEGRLILFCDNEPVVKMLNHTMSSCKFSMTLIRKITLKCLHYNIRIFARHIKGSKNNFSDDLSRGKILNFKKEARKRSFHIDPELSDISNELCPLSTYWKQNCLNLN